MTITITTIAAIASSDAVRPVIADLAQLEHAAARAEVGAGFAACAQSACMWAWVRWDLLVCCVFFLYN